RADRARRRPGDRRRADARGVRAGHAPRRLERPGRRAGLPHRRAGRAPRDDDRRPLRRPDAFLHRRRVAPAHAARQPCRRAGERDDGLGARGPRTRARGGALGARAVGGVARSGMGASWLRRMGLPDVAVLAGGLSAWTDAGGAVEPGHPALVPFGWEAARQRVARVGPADLGSALIVSVDPSDAYAHRHVPGARWLCRSRLEWTIGTVAPDRQAPIVVTCADGVASTLAAAPLGRLGYTAV